MAENQLHNLTTEQVTAMRIICVPDEDARFDLYDDDGTTMDYLKGKYLNTRICMKTGEQTVISFTSTGSYENKVKDICLDVVHREKAPYRVCAAGEEVPHYLHRAKFEAAECGWYYSQTLKSVQIKYPNPCKDYEVIISFEALDLIGM